MNNAAIAQVFQDMADLLELKEDNLFKIRAYQKAARTIETLPEELEQLMKEGRLREIPGVGEAISKKITELLTTGKIDAYDKLRAEFPEGIINLMTIPGVGPKTALRLSKELEISNVDELEKAILEGRVASLYRLGEKTAEAIATFFATEENQELIKKLKKIGIKTKQDVPKESQPLRGKKFVFTGGLQTLSRPDASDLVMKKGGMMASAVGKDIDYVVVGADPGSKYDKAKKLNLKIIDETEFKQLVGVK